MNLQLESSENRRSFFECPCFVFGTFPKIRPRTQGHSKGERSLFMGGRSRHMQKIATVEAAHA